MPILDAETSLFPVNLLVPRDPEGSSLEDPDQKDSDPGDAAPSVIHPHDSERSWWAVYTKARQEKAFARQIHGMEIPFYLPLVPKDNFIRGRRVRSLIPLFGGYVFMFGTEEERYQSLTTNRVSTMLPVTDQSQMFSDLSNVKWLIDSEAPLTFEKRLVPGDPIRVKSGVLAGLEGTVIKRKGLMRIQIAVTMLNQGVSAEIDDFMLEPR